MSSVFSLTTLQTYVDQTNIDLLKTPLLKNKSSTMFNIAAGIKNGQTLPILQVTPFYSNGSSCGYVFSGSVAITERTITVGKVKNSYEYCLKDLEPYFTSQMLQKGSHQESYSAEQDVVQQSQAALMKDLEIATWQASTVASSSAPGLLSFFDGFLRVIENASGSYINASGSVASGNLITGSITVSNVRQLIEQNVYGQIPVEVVDDPAMAVYCGRDVFQTYIQALQLANNGAGVYAVYNKDNPNAINIVGTDVPLIPVNGLNKTSKVVAFSKTNGYIGVDLAADYTDNFRQWYSPDNDTLRMVFDFKYGTQVAFPQFITYAFVH